MMGQVSKVTAAILLLITFLHVHGARTLAKTDLNEANDLLTSADGNAATECDCGPYGLCEFENGQKKCKCTPLSIEFEGKCVECDCGKFSKSCSISSNGTKICVCKSDYVEADGLCTKCDCGDNGLCKIESGQKKCICSPSYVEVYGKCQECECGEATYSCVLDSSGKKKCACLPRYEENNGSCAECFCGRFGSCKYEDGLRKCSCNMYYSERNGTCEFCSCGEKSSNCYFDLNFDQRCTCYKGYAEKDGSCEECDCGYYGSCIFENGRKRCKCKSPTVEINGWCSIITTITDDPDSERSTFLKSTTTHVPITAKTTIQTSTTRACDCGENSIDCHLNMQGENICDCHCGYLQNNGSCEECNCGPYGGCTFENGQKKCICMPFAVEVNGVCVAGTSDPSKIVSSTTEAICSVNKCVHGICEIEENDFKCRCYEGFTGRHCEEKIQIKPNKQDLFMIMILFVTLAIFLLLSGMFCFWTRILSKLSRK